MKTTKYDNTTLVAFDRLSNSQKAQAVKVCPNRQGDEYFRVDESGKIVGYRIKTLK